MARSHQNSCPTNTIMNASATCGGAGGGDSAAIAVTNTAEVTNKCMDNGTSRHITSRWKARSKSHKNNTNYTTINQDVGQAVRGVIEWNRMEYTQQTAKNEGGMDTTMVIVMAAADRRGTQTY